MSFRDLTSSSPLAVLVVAVDEAIARAAARNAALALEAERARRLRWAVEERAVRLTTTAPAAATPVPAAQPLPLPRTAS